MVDLEKIKEIKNKLLVIKECLWKKWPRNKFFRKKTFRWKYF